jgi:hypothetical protein
MHEDANVKPASYSTGKKGSKLVWLPYRPSAKEVRRSREKTTKAKKASEPVKLADFRASSPRTGAMADPFGDRKLREAPAPRLAVDETKEPYNPLAVPPLAPPSVPKDAAGYPRAVPSTNIPAPLMEQGRGSDKEDPLRGLDLPPLPLQDDKDRLAQSTDRSGCPKADDFKPISELTTDVRATGEVFPTECMLKEHTFTPRAWTPTTFTWKASGLCHKPLYFEDVSLERYGHSWGPYLQPIISQGHFFVTIPVLPYFMGVYPPNECMYTLGYYRPGSCAPYMLDPLPISVRGALWEAGVWTGAAYLVP